MKKQMKKVLLIVFCIAFVVSAVGVVTATDKPEEEVAVYTLGISNFRDSFEFCWKVHEDIEEWAEKYGFKTIYAEANMEPEKIKANLDTFALQGVDAIFEFNWLTDVTAKFVREHPDIVMVTGDYIVEGAYYFGANQYQAGVVLGRYLAEQVKERWDGQLDAMIFAACYQCGELLIQRMDGILDGGTVSSWSRG